MRFDWRITFVIPALMIIMNRMSDEATNEINHSLAQLDSENTFTQSHGKMKNQIIDKSKMKLDRTPAQNGDPIWEEYKDFEFSPRYDISTTLAAIEKYQYNPNMGPKVSEKDGWIVFNATQMTENIHPVAIDRSTLRSHPLSHILHIKNANSELKQELNDVGLKTYYYNDRLKILSVESEPHKILETYNNLRKSGLEVQLEVLKDLPQLN